MGRLFIKENVIQCHLLNNAEEKLFRKVYECIQSHCIYSFLQIMTFIALAEWGQIQNVEILMNSYVLKDLKDAYKL